MTSRISYSKPSRENRKRMLGMTIITVLTFFIKAVFLVMGVNVSAQYGNGKRGNRPGGMQCGSKSLLFTFQKADRFL